MAAPSPRCLPFLAPIPRKRGKRGTRGDRTLGRGRLSRSIGLSGPRTPAFRPARRTCSRRPHGRRPARPASRAPPPGLAPGRRAARPRGASPACPGRRGAGTRAARRRAPTPARAAPRWWLCETRPRWCASASRRWCGPGSTSRRHGDRGPAPFVCPCARLGPPSPARPPPPFLRPPQPPPPSPGRCSGPPRRLGERGRGGGRAGAPRRAVAHPAEVEGNRSPPGALAAPPPPHREDEAMSRPRADCLLIEPELPHGGHGAKPDLARSTRGSASRTAPGRYHRKGRGFQGRYSGGGAGRGLARPRPSALAWYPRAGRLASASASWPRVCGVKKHTGNAPGAHLHGGEMGAQPPRPGHHRAGTAPATRAWRGLRKAPGCVGLVGTLPARAAFPRKPASGRPPWGGPRPTRPHTVSSGCSPRAGVPGARTPAPATGAGAGRDRVGLVR